MKFVSTLALAASLALGAGFAAPAAAQDQQAQQAPARQDNLSEEGRKALIPLEQAVTAKDAAAYQAALPAAQAAAKTPDDRYVVAQLQLRRGIDANDAALQLAALEAMAQSGGATAAELPTLYKNIGGLNAQEKRFDQAAAAYEKLAELQPANTDPLIQLARLRAHQKQNGQALSYLERAIAANKSAGTAVPEDWYRLGLTLAYEGKIPAKAASFSRSLVESYPSPDAWHDAILFLRQTTALDSEGKLDALRLMRAAKALRSENAYVELASELERGHYYGEVQDVVREGTASGLVKANAAAFAQVPRSAAAKSAEDKSALAGLEAKAGSDSTGVTAMRIANGYFGHGDYAKPDELYRLAAQKASIDAGLANMRLGIALAMQGKKAEADAAFKAVGGTRAELAGLWSLWLSQRS